MNEIIERVARAMYEAVGPEAKWDVLEDRLRTSFHSRAIAAVAAVFDDPDIQELLKWLDFKASGKPDSMWDGARKLIDVALKEAP